VANRRTVVTERAIRQNDKQIIDIISGRRTQLRKVLECQPFQNEDEVGSPVWHINMALNRGHGTANNWRGTRVVGKKYKGFDYETETHLPLEQWLIETCPYGSVSDTLWIQEAWSSECGDPDHKECFRYRAGYDFKDGLFSWRSSATMGRHAARLVLKIEKIRVHKIQSITVEDVAAEGADVREDGMVRSIAGAWDPLDYAKALWKLQHSYFNSWETNPWVYAIDFKVIEGGMV
jgi:hypothetical protein